jgi:hypothetical protein
MRILVAPLNYDHPQIGQLDAFQRVFGTENVALCDYMAAGKERRSRRQGTPDHLLYTMAMQHRPDWIWMQLQDTNKISGDCLFKIRQELPQCVITHWTGDLRPQVSDYLSSICKATHVTFCSSVGQIPMFEAAGAPIARYLQIGLDRQEDIEAPHREPPFHVPDVVFCGGYYGDTFPGTKDREDAIRALMAAGIDTGVVGNGWPGWVTVLGTCPVKEQIHIWRAAKICLNVNHYNDVERYYSDRQIIAMASGTPLVCRYIPGLEVEFQNWKHCVWYNTLEGLVKIVKGLLSDESMRRTIGECGRREVVEHHTWESRVRSALPLIEEIRCEI